MSQNYWLWAKWLFVINKKKNGIYEVEDQVNPLNIYGKTRELGEKITRTYSNHIIIRTSWVFGINGKNFVKTKPWYLVAGLGVLIVILSLFAFLIPVKYSSSTIYEMVDRSVFCITAEGPSTKQAGSGFFINDTGLAVTNYHIIENCTSGKQWYRKISKRGFIIWKFIMKN